MARRISLFLDEWVVYLDDVEREIEIPDPENEGETIKEMRVVCAAIEVGDRKMLEGESTFNLKNILLPTTLKIGNLARRGQHDEVIYMILRKSISGWNNVGNGSDKTLPFNRKNVDFLPLEEASALAAFVMDKIGGDKVKQERTEDRNLGNS